MSVGLTVLAALGPALGKALYEVGKKVVAEPLMGPAAEQVEGWVRRGYDARVKDARARAAVEAAVKASGLTRWEDWGDYPLRAALDRLGGKGFEELRESTLATALAMTDDAPEEVPGELAQALGVDERHRPDLARFLWALRNALAKADEDYRALVTLSHQDAVRQRLGAIASDVERLLSTVMDLDDRTSEILAKLVDRDARQVESSYLKAVMAQCSTLPLGGRDFRDSTPLGLSMPLERVYIALNTTEQPAEARGWDMGVGDVAEARDMKRVSALRAFLESEHLVLLGEPGSGKTTFADHLALCLARERLEPEAEWAEYLKSHDAEWEGQAPLPVRVRLRHFAADRECLPVDRSESGQAEHLLAYVRKRLEDGGYDADLPAQVLGRLEQGDALVILDGLDEVGDSARREQVAQAIVDLAQHRYPRARLLVTCRVRQYPMDTSGRPLAAWALPGFHVVTLADFEGSQIDAFVRAWFTVLCDLNRFSDEVREDKIRSLTDAIRVRPDLQEIAPRPILLTQMALVHDIEGELPATRVKLYDICADLLLWKWEQWRAKQAGQQLMAEDWIQEEMDMPGLRKDDLQRALDHAVYDAHAGQGAADEGPTDIPEDMLRRRVCECLKRTDRRMPNHDAIGKAQFFMDEYLRRRNGLIVPAGEHTFQTPHRTFQEFLAARWLQLLDRDFDRAAPDLVRENYDLWREVFLLAVGQARLGSAVDAVHNLCPREWPRELDGWQRLILAGQGLDEIGLPKVRSDEYRGPETEEHATRLLRRTMQDTHANGEPNVPSLVPVPTRYAAAETLDRLGWLPRGLDAFVEVSSPGSSRPIYVGKYLVTNHQFARFMDDGGYKEQGRHWWSEEGWDWRIEGHPGYRGQGPVKQPEYWDHPRLGKSRPGYPVVGVSWYEAVAYCAWLTEELRAAQSRLQVWRNGRSENLSLEPDGFVACLPTEEEWVTAAGGEGEDRYPWGQEWDASCANTDEGGIGGTSPVGMYPSGRSRDARSGELIGVWDMGGNVWEWMASRYEEVEREAYALRGGSWYAHRGLARVAVRSGTIPISRSTTSGFGWWCPPLVLVADLLSSGF